MNVKCQIIKRKAQTKMIGFLRNIENGLSDKRKKLMDRQYKEFTQELVDCGLLKSDDPKVIEVLTAECNF